jgi:predicted RNA-binding protein YlxR (DUF448 family)
VRVVRTADGGLRCGRDLEGRGAWLCAVTAVACLDLATHRRAWPRALRGEVAPPAVAELRQMLQTGSE